MPATTPDFSGQQGYLGVAPTGVGALGVAGVAGGTGTGVKVMDVEGAWLWTHEDLTTPFATAGTPIADLGWRNHGTGVMGEIRGMKTRIQLYTVPGQVFYNATRRMVLKGADAVCFVCDSQEAMLDANLESFQNMRQNLEANEIDPDEIPLVFQYNKRDLPNALPIEILNERMNPHNYPFYEAIAGKGAGVEDTLKAVTKLVFKSLSAKYGDGAVASPPGRAPGPRRHR